MIWAAPALIVAAFLVGLMVGRAPLHALRHELGLLRRDLVHEREQRDEFAADADRWRKRANNTAARLGALRAEECDNVVPMWSNGRFHP